VIQVVKNLEVKVEELKNLESTAIEQQAKVTQLESQGELNVSLLFSSIQSFIVGKTLLLFYDRMN
jgi:hypothetical protein